MALSQMQGFVDARQALLLAALWPQSLVTTFKHRTASTLNSGDLNKAAHLSESSSSYNLQRLKVIQAKSGPLEA